MLSLLDLLQHGLQIPLFARNDIIGQRWLEESEFCQRIAQHLQERRRGSAADCRGNGRGYVVARGHFPPWQPLRNSTKRMGLVFADEDSPSPFPSPST